MSQRGSCAVMCVQIQPRCGTHSTNGRHGSAAEQLHTRCGSSATRQRQQQQLAVAVVTVTVTAGAGRAARRRTATLTATPGHHLHRWLDDSSEAPRHSGHSCGQQGAGRLPRHCPVATPSLAAAAAAMLVPGCSQAMHSSCARCTNTPTASAYHRHIAAAAAAASVC